jgi:hypothetical protein
VLTGFNTDIEHAGVVYHVQTEDKGMETPMILTLVYSGGAILASKRSPYDDLIEKGYEEAVLAERVNRQHKLICAAVLAGRLSDLKKMTEREAATRQSAKAEPKKPAPKPATKKVTRDLPPPEDLTTVVPIEIVEAEVVPIPDAGEFQLADAYEVVAEFARAESIEHSPIRIKFSDDQELRGGVRAVLKVTVLRGADGHDVISGADVVIKVLGSTFKPLVFQSKTGPNGVASIRMQIPHFSTGRAAILARAFAEGYEAELRRIIRQG